MKKSSPSKFGIKVFCTCLAWGLVVSTGVQAGKPGDGGVTIMRDIYGAPHVFGSTDASLWYGVGYAQAQDRLWQAEILRRTATGRTAELFGPAAIAGDITLRAILGTDAERMAQINAGSDEQKVILSSFAAGMNAYIAEATAAGTLPFEFTLFDFTPDEWKPTDSIAVLQLIWFDFGAGGGEELTNAAHLQELIAINGPEAGAAIFGDTHWLDDPDAPTTVPSDGGINPPRRGAAAGAKLPPGLVSGYSGMQTSLDPLRRNLRRVGLGNGAASNAAIISPELSADGRALLLGGPQLGYSTPQLSHEMGIHGGRIDLTGVAPAGVPSIFFGVTKDIAWTMTVGGTDNQDVYVEEVNPQNTGQYLFNGEWRDFDCRVETFGVAGAPDVEQTICESVHGPVIATPPGLAFSLKTVGRGKVVQAHQAFLGVARARTVADVDDALEKFAFNVNLFYADKRGNIAHWHTGEIPIRAEGDNPWLPHDGTGGAEWQGYIPWENMPRTLNPDQGWISSWNNKPRPGWENSRINFWNWGPVHRVNTFNNFLSRLTPGTSTTQTLEELNIVGGWTNQTPSGDARNVFVPTLLDILLDNVDVSLDPRLPGIVALLGSWDWMQLDLAPMDGVYDSPAVAIFNTWWPTLTSRVFGDELDSLMPSFDNAMGNLVYRLLVDGAALPLAHDYLDGETKEGAVTAALVEALDALEADFGSGNPAEWLQPVAEIVWTPLPGASAVPNTIWMNRGTYNVIVHHGPGPYLHAQNIVAPGQSGDRSSPHFEDQLDNYANWIYKPMRLKRKDLNGATESVTRLKPVWPD